MQVTFFGTRGSTAVSGPDKIAYGGNTTCVRVQSPCLPEAHWLVIDAGTGIVPLSGQFAQSAGKAVTILHTHYHHDHTQGLALSAFPYLKSVALALYGPFEHGIGPKQVYTHLMRSPYFPVNFAEVASHFACHDIPFPSATVLLIHPKGGTKKIPLATFEVLERQGQQMPFTRGQRYALAECLVVRMHRSNHPEQTISYRFEERPTGRSFVFVTDHENQSGMPTSFLNHVRGANLLVMDCQYTDEKYLASTAGWGHASPSYVSAVACAASVVVLGLTHHDPWSSDELVDRIVATTSQLVAEQGIQVFGCRDNMIVEV